MLKITTNGSATEQKWMLCGQLTGPWVTELRRMWERESGIQTRIVDLSDVTSIDDRGEALLRKMKQEGAQFVARGVNTCHILDHLQSDAQPALRKFLKHLQETE